MSDIRGRDFLKLADFETGDIDEILNLAFEMKREQRHWSLKGKTIIMLFFNSSLRTRTSFEIGAAQLGAQPVVLKSAAAVRGRDRVGLQRDHGGDLVEHQRLATAVDDLAARRCDRHDASAIVGGLRQVLIALQHLEKPEAQEEDREDPDGDGGGSAACPEP